MNTRDTVIPVRSSFWRRRTACGKACATLTLSVVIAACQGAPFAKATAVDNDQLGGGSRQGDVAVGNAAPGRPLGFGAGVTGGAGGEVVRVATSAELKYALCHQPKGDTCLDSQPRVVEIVGTIDMTQDEGYEHANTACLRGSTQNACVAPLKREVTIARPGQDWQNAYCGGLPLLPGGYAYPLAPLLPLQVGSNKTIIGATSGAGVKGRAFFLNHVSNVIITNLSITDINDGVLWGGDAITLADVKNVWIDHNYIARVGRQFIVSGSGGGATDLVTISFNDFDGRTNYTEDCSGKHYWMFLFAGYGRLTMYGNYIHDFAGRGPHIDPGTKKSSTIQIVNNYFENGIGHAIDAANQTRVLVEGNYFENVMLPVAQPNPTRGALYGVWRQTDEGRKACVASLGRACADNKWDKPAPAPGVQPQDNMEQDSFALNAIGVEARNLIKPYSANDVGQLVKSDAGPGHVAAGH